MLGSDLTSSVAAILAANTASTLDTNGLNATWSGVLSGTGAFTKIGNGTLTLSGANTYTGPTTITNGTLALAGGAAISDASDVSLTGATAVLQISASETIGSLTGVANSTVTLGNGVVLTAGASNASTTFAGVIAGGNSTSGLTKAGTGTLTLTGAISYTGDAVVNGGTLALSGSGAI